MSGVATCAICGTAILISSVGRPRLYCAGACKQKAYRVYQSGILCRVSFTATEYERLRRHIDAPVPSTADPYVLPDPRLGSVMEAIAGEYFTRLSVQSNLLFKSVHASECWMCHRWFTSQRANTRRYCSDRCRSRALRARRRGPDLGHWARLPLSTYCLLAYVAPRRQISLGQLIAGAVRPTTLVEVG